MLKADGMTYPSLITAHLQFHFAAVNCIESFWVMLSRVTCFLGESKNSRRGIGELGF
jgi:hypothetical protein